MVHLFLLVLVLLDYTRLANSGYLHFALNIQLESSLCVDEFSTRDQPGSYWISIAGSNTRSTHILPTID